VAILQQNFPALPTRGHDLDTIAFHTYLYPPHFTVHVQPLLPSWNETRGGAEMILYQLKNFVTGLHTCITTQQFVLLIFISFLNLSENVCFSFCSLSICYILLPPLEAEYTMCMRYVLTSSFSMLLGNSHVTHSLSSPVFSSTYTHQQLAEK